MHLLYVLSITLITLLTCRAFDLPIHNKLTPQIACLPKRCFKYFDVAQQQWIDSEDSYVRTYNSLLKFCQKAYPDKAIQDVIQQQFRTKLTFCNLKSRMKCVERDAEIYTCDSPLTGPTEEPSSTPNDQSVVPVTCFNETIRVLEFSTCQSVVSVVHSNYCSNLSLNLHKMNNVTTCNTTSDGEPTEGLLSASLQCCSKYSYPKGDPVDSIFTVPGIFPLVNEQHSKNLNFSWCNYAEVDKKMDQITSSLLQKIKNIYSNESREVNRELYMEIKATAEGTLHKDVVELYTPHFNCMRNSVRTDLNYCRTNILSLGEENSKQQRVADIMTTLDHVNASLTKVERDFTVLTERYLAGLTPGFTKQYRDYVINMQNLRNKVNQIKKSVDNLLNCVECFTAEPEIPIATQPNFDVGQETSSKTPQDVGDDDNKKSGLEQKYLVVIVSSVSCITIIIAFIFFLVVVRRTLAENRSQSRKLRNYPNITSNNEQYVTFLQKNGYSNPSCKLSNKYFDEHD